MWVVLDELAAGFAKDKLADPLLLLPPHRPHSVRRVSSMQIVPDPSWDLGIRVRAVAQDRHYGAESLSEAGPMARLDVTIDPISAIAGMTSTAPDSVVGALIGRPAISGFRAVLAKLDGELNLSSPEAALFDDLPTVRLIAGYARLMNEEPRPGPSQSPMLNVCRGWAEGDTAHQRAIAGMSLAHTTTDAPYFADMLHDEADFLDEFPSTSDSMRRRRILEVSRSGRQQGGFEIFEYFRDSYTKANGVESSLHEYLVYAECDADLVLTEIRVEPRSLPFPECPLASPNAATLAGSSLREIHPAVRQNLAATRGCTHLSDTLRFLRFADPLSATLTG